MDKYYFECTEYPNKFKDVYWGNFLLAHQEDKENLKKIFKNRNNFVKEFNINRYLTSKPYCEKLEIYLFKNKQHSLFDHVEYYSIKNSKDIIILISPYSDIEKSKPNVYKKMMDMGWKHYNILYNTGANTYVLKTNRNILKNLSKK